MSNYLRRLEKPKGIIDVVLDTDTYNEIDDQFALAYMVKKTDRFNIKAIYAAPFYNSNSSGPEDGMEKSYREIFKILSLMKRDDLTSSVYRGSAAYLPSEDEPVESEAARRFAELASGYSSENPLYVVAIGAVTNIASALLTKPEIKDKIVLVWLGGHAYDWPNNKEFNLNQDIAAARVIFGCGVPVVQLPCKGVVSAFTISGPELEFWLRGKNGLCDYLVDTTVSAAKRESRVSTWTRPVWDVTAVAWLVEGNFMLDRLEPSPIPEYDGHYAFDKTRHLIKYVYYINRDLLFEDLFRTLSDDC